jgi:hypothetical protein
MDDRGDGGRLSDTADDFCKEVVRACVMAIIDCVESPLSNSVEPRVATAQNPARTSNALSTRLQKESWLFVAGRRSHKNNEMKYI